MTGQERSKVDLEERIQLAQQAIASESEAHAKIRTEIIALEGSRKVHVFLDRLSIWRVDVTTAETADSIRLEIHRKGCLVLWACRQYHSDVRVFALS